MKKATSARRGRAATRRAAPKSVADYLAAVPEPARSALERVRAAIRSVVPVGTIEVISYGIPMFKYKGMLMGYAAFSNHCSLFPGAVLEGFEDELKDYQMSKGTIRFTMDRPLPAPLVKKLVKARVAKNQRASKR